MKQRNPRFIHLNMDEPLQVKEQLREMIPGSLCKLVLQSPTDYNPDSLNLVYEGLLPTDFSLLDSEFEYTPDCNDAKSKDKGFSFLGPIIRKFSLGTGAKRAITSSDYEAIISYRIPEVIEKNISEKRICTPYRSSPFCIPPYFEKYVKRMFFVTHDFYREFSKSTLNKYPEELLKRKLDLL